MARTKKTFWQIIVLILDGIGTLMGIWFFLMIVLVLIFGGEIKIQVNWSSWTNIPLDIKYCLGFIICIAIPGFFVIRKEFNRPVPENMRQKRIREMKQKNNV